MTIASPLTGSSGQRAVRSRILWGTADRPHRRPIEQWLFSVTRLSYRLAVSALALVALAAVFGLGSPRPRAAGRERGARTVVRAGSLRTSDRAGGTLSGDDHHADATAADQSQPVRPVLAAAAATIAPPGGRAGSAPPGRRAAFVTPPGTARRDASPTAPDVLLPGAVPPFPLLPVITIPRSIGARPIVPFDGSGPASGRAPPAV